MEYSRSLSSFTLIIQIIIILLSCVISEVVHKNAAQNSQAVNDQQAICNELRSKENDTDAEDTCKSEFIFAMCWTATRRGSVTTVYCPPYNDFNTSATATMFCSVDGVWNRTSMYNMDCIEHLNGNGQTESPADSSVQDHSTHIRRIWVYGSGISVMSLVIAGIVMIVLRMHRRPTNIIHLNLFISIMMRGIASLLINLVVYSDFGQKNLVTRKFDEESGQYIFDNSRLHWECKLITSIWMFSRVSNFTWILIEGFYLHMLLYVNQFSTKMEIKWIVSIGWVVPVQVTIAWVVARIITDNHECWVTYGSDKEGLKWIIEAPNCFCILVSFAFFISMMSILCSKHRHQKTRGVVRKLIKATLILIPIFGVPYMIFLPLQFIEKKSVTVILVWFYFDITFQSFQGLMVACIYCIVYSEVRKALWKRCHGVYLSVKESRRQSNSSTRTSTIAADNDQHKEITVAVRYKIGSEQPDDGQEGCKLLFMTRLDDKLNNDQALSAHGFEEERKNASKEKEK